MAYGRVWVLIEGGSTENELWEMENCMCFHRVWVICGMGYYRVDCTGLGVVGDVSANSSLAVPEERTLVSIMPLLRSDATRGLAVST